MIQCPDCRSLIPDDSAFCDQCGKELKWCPKCRRPKRGTECPLCGSDLIPGRKYFSGGTPEETAAPDSSVSPQPAELVGNGWRLPLRPGGFGRLGGIWPELGTCQYVSGNHGNIHRGPDGWEMADAGSTNGTYVNGQRLATGSAVVLKKGDSVRIATLDFIVE
ncbi:MAG: FHA domain-containing protein [Bacteroidales bacterium]|nr:FHA domain-containing protein [Bacteroidales bacterium]